MAKTYDELDRCDALVAIATAFYQRGWMPGSAGNLSAREAAGSTRFWITASGLPKGQLDARDFLLVDSRDGRVVEQRRAEQKPSAETSIHQAIYRCFPEANACLHVHSVDSSLVGRALASGATALRLPPLEVIKIFNLWQQDPEVDLPVFPNWLDVPRIAREIEQRFTAQPPPISALLIRDHGITVWGESLQAAFNRVECIEFILSYVARVERSD